MSTPALALRVISLPGSTERRQAVAKNLTQTALPWEFLDASRADGDSPLAADPAAQRDAFGRALTPGEIGCFKSHMRALETFDADPALDWLLVMEDDVWIDTAFPFADLAAHLDETGIDFLRLFCREWRRGYPRDRFGARQILFLASDPYGTQGYLISRAAAARFRASVRAILRPIDDEMGRFWENGLGNHLLFPFPMLERHAPSTLSDGRDSAGDAKAPDTFRRRRRKVADYLVKRAYLAWRLSPFARHPIRPQRR